MIRDGNGDPILDVDRAPIKKTHGHTWILLRVHAHVQDELGHGDRKPHHRSNGHHEELHAGAAREGADDGENEHRWPVLVPRHAQHVPRIGWDKEWFREHGRGLAR